MVSEVTADLQQWSFEQLRQRQWCYRTVGLSPLTGDAGFRHYYRVPASPALLAVLAPAATENNRAFVAIAEYLRDHGVNAPQVVAVDYQRGFLLVEDFGDRLYLPELNSETVEVLYGAALMTLLRIQQCPPTDRVPVYDGPRLREELERMREWLPRLLDYSLNRSEHKLLDQVFGQLIDSALEQPQVLVHRDFHSRNLLIRDAQAPGVIDFQDAVWGPLTYDLVSLLRDCYIRWPQEDVRRWALAYGNMAFEVGLLEAVEASRFLRWFDWMGLQRHLKVLGTFSRLWLRDGKTRYLNDLPLVMRYVLEVASSYSEFSDFCDWFKTQLLPLAQRQSWYRDYLTAGEC